MSVSPLLNLPIDLCRDVASTFSVTQRLSRHARSFHYPHKLGQSQRETGNGSRIQGHHSVAMDTSCRETRPLGPSSHCARQTLPPRALDQFAMSTVRSSHLFLGILTIFFKVALSSTRKQPTVWLIRTHSEYLNTQPYSALQTGRTHSCIGNDSHRK